MRKGFLYALAACTAIALTACGTGSNNEWDTLPDTEPETFMTEGRFLWSGSGNPMIVIDNTGPCTISTDDDTMFAEFTDGDLIKLEYDGGIAESYPGQIHHVYSAYLIEDGDITDIDQSVLDSLIEMGHIEAEPTAAQDATDAGHWYTQGRFILSDSGTAMIDSEDYGLCEFASDAEMLEGLTTGDLIELDFYGTIAESDPAQILGTNGVTLIMDGVISDIDAETLEFLKANGYISE